jgi:hypothetical protein
MQLISLVLILGVASASLHAGIVAVAGDGLVKATGQSHHHQSVEGQSRGRSAGSAFCSGPGTEDHA